jgi:hypothetical protein
MKQLFFPTKFLNWLARPNYRIYKIAVLLLLTILFFYLLYQLFGYFRFLIDPRSQVFLQWARGNSETRADLVTVQREACPGAPFVLPTDGFIGLLYEDPRGPYSSANLHQGIDIFSNTEPGINPVYAAYDGYVTRENGWRSALIIRVPDDPLDSGRMIWLYYAHMADREGNSFIVDSFPPGTREKYVEQGTLLGYTGDYNGNASRTIWVHLHFSIVKDDGNGRYANELEFNNTVDPSPYLGMVLNYNCTSETAGCTSKPLCTSS